ncbi:complex I NDUFA9 subunit family protein [Oleiagrimonas sp. C23AA]|uniref:complex I NDUFA9 subunit family protein n=1 Tax=Oleiagrimonas sp. C23AA TaxID=2719047 RepID=UPI00141E205A|nr:complex I NDUFA9 subunit family protein [Oleiagrimonas sp. C23AA]NII11393.1 complex I NDUFA9 subunit family protein [Oleiagrimonas sp. C23AA]
MKPKRIVLLGATGFVGSYLVPRLAADGHQLLLLSRNRNRQRALAVLPGVRMHSADVYDRQALTGHFAGADAVINLVGILNETGRATFQRAHVELTEHVIAACNSAGVSRLHQMSSLKAGQGLSRYLKTRGEAEARVKASDLIWTIYQPSVIFGRGDGLVTRFAKLLKLSPVLPLARPQSRMAPVYAGDVAAAIARSVADSRISRCSTLELYGPDVFTLEQIVRMVAEAGHMHRLILGLPDSLGRLQAQVAGLLPGKPMSLDNFLSLRTDSVGRHDGLAALGITPHHFQPMLASLLGSGGR